MLHRTDLARVDLNLLVLFDVVLAEGHVGRAASRLALSPSAVSHGIARLRRMLDDPLFLKHPKGVVPTERASALAAPIAEVLEGARRVVGLGERFDPSTSKRRFVVGGPDAILAVVAAPLMAAVRRSAPGVDVAFRDLFPFSEASYQALDRREIDAALLPAVGTNLPARFETRPIYEETFLVAMREDHPLGPTPTLAAYCAADHLLVSEKGDAHGLVDIALAERGARRRVSLVVPHFLLALAVLAQTDLVSALPAHLLHAHASRFGLVTARLPVRVPESRICAVAPRVALDDAGLAWLLGLLGEARDALGDRAPVSRKTIPRRAKRSKRGRSS